MDVLFPVGATVKVFPRRSPLAQQYTGETGRVVSHNDAAGYYVIAFGEDEYDEVQLCLSEEEVEPA